MLEILIHLVPGDVVDDGRVSRGQLTPEGHLTILILLRYHLGLQCNINIGGVWNIEISKRVKPVLLLSLTVNVQNCGALRVSKSYRILNSARVETNVMTTDLQDI